MRRQARLTLAFLALLLPSAYSQTPVFVGWPSSITNVWTNVQIAFTNPPSGLFVTNADQASAVVSNPVGGFNVGSSPGWVSGPTFVNGSNGFGYLELYFQPGTNVPTNAYTNIVTVFLTNAAGRPIGQQPSASTNITVVITPPPANKPVFTTNFIASWPAAPGTNSITVGARFDSTNPPSSPVLYPGPDITNLTAVYAIFLSNSIGETAFTNSGTVPGTNVAYYSTSTGFGFYPNYTNLPANLIPASPWQVSTNPVVSSAIWLTNNQAWIGLNLFPGTSTNFITNYVQLLAFNGNNASTANWTTNNVAIVVAPTLPTPPALQIRFYNSSTNAASNVFILPSSTDTFGSYGNGFWWSNALSGSNNWTNWSTTGGIATVRLSDIGVSGTNAQGQAYYAIFTTNFPNAAWYLGYGGGSVATNATPPSPHTGQTWFGYEWAAFEVTLDGSPADKSDTTYINQFSIPMALRVLTNDYTASAAGVYPSNSLAYYQVCGFTNWTNPSSVAVILSNLATQFSVKFPNAAITNAAGKTVMYAGPSSSGMGSLQGPSGAAAFPSFSGYFAAVLSNSNAAPAIQDSIGLSAATNTPNLGANPVFLFAYDFDLVVTSSNALLLTNGTINVINQPGSTGTNLAVTNYTGLWMQVGPDAGPSDSWASSLVYLASTPANYVLNYGQTNVAMQTYTAGASNGLAGTPVFQSSTNLWLQIATNTGTVAGTNRVIIPNPTAFDLYQSQFGTAVMGRILGDLAAGFALGFINSSATNPVTTNTFGNSPSGSWWGGNEYPQAGLLNSQSYSDVNTYYSEWGGTIYSGTKVTYGHPIYDRMQFYGAGNPDNPLQIQPSSATNNQVTVAGVPTLLPVWVVEVEFFNGLSSVGSNAPVPVLTYSNWLTNYPSLTGGETNTSADPDGDGFANGEEYAFGGNPTIGTPALLAAGAAGTNAVFSYIGLDGGASSYAVQHTTNLSTGPWTNATGLNTTNSADQSGIPLPAFYGRREFVVPSGGTTGFFRVVFTNAP